MALKNTRSGSMRSDKVGRRRGGVTGQDAGWVLKEAQERGALEGQADGAE